MGADDSLGRECDAEVAALHYLNLGLDNFGGRAGTDFQLFFFSEDPKAEIAYGKNEEGNDDTEELGHRLGKDRPILRKWRGGSNTRM